MGTSLHPVPPLSIRDRAIAEGFSLVYMMAVAGAATFTGISYLLFPELAALAHDVLTRPWGKWASQPVRLILTPVLTAIMGTFITRHLPYHVLTILLIVLLSVGIVRLIRSNIAPAISAGLLPLVLGQKSWVYPFAIVGTLAALAILSQIWRGHCQRRNQPAASATAGCR